MDNSKRSTLALLMDWPESSSYHCEILAGVHAEAQRADVNILVLGIGNLGEFSSADSPLTLGYEYLASRRIHGAILCTTTMATAGQVSRLLKRLEVGRSLPMVSLGETVPGLPSILTGNHQGFSLMLEHLFNHHGYRHPVFVAGPRMSFDSQVRLKAFQTALAAHGIAFSRERVYYGDFQLHSGEEAVAEFLDAQGLNVDVVVCANDYMALGVRQAVQKRGLTPGRDIAITGFDDIRMSGSCESPLTTVRQPIREAAALAVHILTERIDEPLHTLPTEFILRGSCGCPVPTSELDLSRHQDDAVQHMIHEERERFLNYNVMTVVEKLRDRTPSTGREAIESQVLQRLGLRNWFLTLWLDGKSRLFGDAEVRIAWQAGAPVPMASLQDYPALDILPEGVCETERWTLVLCLLEEANRYFGTLLLDYRPDLKQTYESLRIRFSEALSALENQRELQDLSLHDELTGLENRRGYLALATHHLSCARRDGQMICVSYFDLDGLKWINDTWGHQAGDTAIHRFGQLLKACFRESDVVARFGGDEFALFATQSNAFDPISIRGRLDLAVEEENARSSAPWRLQFSMGTVSVDHHDLRSLEQIMHEADHLLYSEKRLKKSIRGTGNRTGSAALSRPS